jgi:phosphate transport system permease protein
LDVRRNADFLATAWMRGALLLVNLLALLIGLGLLFKSWPILSRLSLLRGLLSSDWSPARGQFGFVPFIAGTVAVTLLAMTLAVPVCLLSALCIAEHVGRRWKWPVKLAMDVMAGIPSVLYGLFGILVIVPFVRGLGEATGHSTSGYSLLAGGIVLAIMVSPLIISISVEAMESVPRQARETALSLGATRWETTRHAVLRHARPGIISAVVIGFARAFGETMAVLMVVGNVAKVPGSLFDPAYPIPALIANNYGEMMSVPRYDSALMLGALFLMAVVGMFNLAAHRTLLRGRRQTA